VAGIFIDSSALVKRYVTEDGTPFMRQITYRYRKHFIYIAHITAVEVTSAVTRRRRDREITPKKASSILSRFRGHLIGRYNPLEISAEIIAAAMTLANVHSLRAYDAVQLAAALRVYRDWSDAELGDFLFVSADKRLNDAARAEGLSVEDPRDHT
jgi:predicted nucleic acid-binding protein